MQPSESLYDQDFQAWLEQQITLLQAGEIKGLDVPHLIAELQDMGKSNLRELRSRLLILIAHLLKWQFQSKKRRKSWKRSIDEQRVRIRYLVKENPNLKREFTTVIADAFTDAAYLAMRETQLPPATFPAECPYTLEQLLDDDFYPKNIPQLETKKLV